MQSNTSKIVLAVIITAIVVGGGIYYWQNSQTITEPDVTTINTTETTTDTTTTTIEPDVTTINTTETTTDTTTTTIEPDITTQPPSISSDLETYSSEKYSFQYPKGYFVVADSSGIILTVRKATNQQEADSLGRDATKNRLEIFQMKDFGERPWGFEGTETQEEIDGYVPKETLTVGSGNKQYDIWLYYSENDTQIKNELKTIFDSIIIK